MKIESSSSFSTTAFRVVQAYLVCITDLLGTFCGDTELVGHPWQLPDGSWIDVALTDYCVPTISKRCGGKRRTKRKRCLERRCGTRFSDILLTSSIFKKPSLSENSFRTGVFSGQNPSEAFRGLQSVSEGFQRFSEAFQRFCRSRSESLRYLPPAVNLHFRAVPNLQNRPPRNRRKHLILSPKRASISAVQPFLLARRPLLWARRMSTGCYNAAVVILHRFRNTSALSLVWYPRPALLVPRVAVTA